MKDKKNIQKKFNNEFYNKKDNYNAIISAIRKENKMNNNKLLKTISAAIITILGTGGIVFAGTKIYNEYVKKQETSNSTSLVSVKNDSGFSDDFIINNMKLEENSNISNVYYKIISNIDDYNLFKEKEGKLPEISKDDLEENMLLVIFKSGQGQPHEMDLEITDINYDESNTYIVLEQKENPDFNKTSNLIYAIIDKKAIKDNIKINLKEQYISDLDKLPKDYSKEDALRDGCFVVDEYKVISNNKKQLDEFIEKANKKEESSIRVFRKYNGYTYIMDLAFSNNIFTLNSASSEDNYKNINITTGKYLEKRQSGENKEYFDFNIKDYDNKDYIGTVFLTVDLK